MIFFLLGSVSIISAQSSSQFELRGIYSHGDIQMFSVYDSLNESSFWLEPGQSLGNFKVVSYNDCENTLTVRFGSDEFLLELTRPRGTPISVLNNRLISTMAAASKRGQPPSRTSSNSSSIDPEKKQILKQRAQLRNLRVQLQTESALSAGETQNAVSESDKPYLAPAAASTGSEDETGPNYIRILQLRDAEED